MNLTKSEIATHKVKLQSYGIKCNENIDYRITGAGPAGGIDLIINGAVIDAPVSGNFTQNSPYTLVKHNTSWHLNYNNEFLTEITLPKTPSFYEKTTSENIPMRLLAKKHGIDCLATTVFSHCMYWSAGSQCKFCGIEIPKKNRIIKKTKEQLTEVAHEAEKDGLKHITLTTGTPNIEDKGSNLLAEIARNIKSETNLNVHVQFEAVGDEAYIEKVYQAEADTIGIHIESFDQRALEKICPAKSKIDMKIYEKCWNKAIDLFGNNQVSSFLILGLGEDREKTILGIEKCTQYGVIPYVVPFRPILGTELENSSPPRPEYIDEILQLTSQCLRKNNVDPTKNKAGCVRCGCCSALKEYYKLNTIEEIGI